jgi:voltage-gated sodium channel
MGVKFEHLIAAGIAINAVAFAVGWVDSDLAEPAELVERGTCVLFVIEMAVKMRVQRWRFFRRPMNLFDLIVIMLTLLPMTAAGNFAVARTLRIVKLAKGAHLVRHASTLRVLELGHAS